MKTFYFCLFFPTILFSQTIKGTINDKFNKPLNYANVLIKEFNKPNEIIEYTICEKGKYIIRLEKKYTKIIIEINAFGYKKEIKLIDNPKSEKTYNISFSLSKNERTTTLEEVVIVANKKPFAIKKDTVKYNVNSYLDGSEKKIQDVIKKIPGIEVNEESGEIKYKGKSIETVLLEGDNLFNHNYTLGTKNINVDMVKQIEAIEKYSENPLLKGIENGDKVALNLKLKKGRIDFSGNIDFGYGFFEKHKQALNLNSNLLGITKNYKSFATLAYNNIGINHSSFDYFGYNPNVEQLKEKDFFAEKIIPETSFSTNILNSDRSNINNQYFGNYNAILKINKRLKIRTNLYYINDNIKSNQIFENLYTINENSFTTSDYYSIIKKPTQYRGDIDIKYNTSKKSLLEYNLRIRQENIKTPSNVISNNNVNFNSSLKSEDFYFKQKLLYTQKLSKSKALQVSFFQSTNKIPQTYQISPSVINPTNYNQDIQRSQFKKNHVSSKVTFLGSTNNNKYTFSIGNTINTNFFHSELFSKSLTENTIAENSFNDLKYSKTTFYQLGTYNLNFGKLLLSPAYSLNYIKQEINNKVENTFLNENNFIFEPSLKIKYKLNQISFFLGKIGLNQVLNTEKHLFENQVLINNRIFINNSPNLKFQKTLSYGIYYYNNDLYNQLQINLGINYQNRKGNYFTNSNLTENTTQINYFYLPQSNKNINFSFLIDKYISFLESTIKITSNYSISRFKNIVNNSDLRSNKSHFFNTKLYIKTAFDGLINFKNTFDYSKSISGTENNSAFINSSINNNFDIILSPSNKWFALISSNYLIPNLNEKRESYTFLDFSLRFKPKNKNIEFNFKANNILNENNIKQIQTSDFSTSIFSTNILARYYLLNVTYNF